MDKIREEILSDAIKSCIEAERKIIVYRRVILTLETICAILAVTVVCMMR